MDGVKDNVFTADKDRGAGYTLIKPHHFLDYLYDLAVGERHENEQNLSGNSNGELCRQFIDGKIKKIKFTPFADDICRPCKKLAEGKMCLDYFDDATTLYYGFRYKNDFNYQLDLKLNEKLPDVFCFDKVWDMPELLFALEKGLTADIINMYKWQRPSRAENTFFGIKKGKEIYR